MEPGLAHEWRDLHGEIPCLVAPELGVRRGQQRECPEAMERAAVGDHELVRAKLVANRLLTLPSGAARSLPAPRGRGTRWCAASRIRTPR